MSIFPLRCQLGIPLLLERHPNLSDARFTTIKEDLLTLVKVTFGAPPIKIFTNEEGLTVFVLYDNPQANFASAEDSLAFINTWVPNLRTLFAAYTSREEVRICAGFDLIPNPYDFLREVEDTLPLNGVAIAFGLPPSSQSARDVGFLQKLGFNICPPEVYTPPA